MDEDKNETCADVDMDSTEIVFDNLAILREFGNIVDRVREVDFLEAVPKAKLKRVKWTPMFNCLKQGILDEMVQELNTMWKFENMPEKLAILERQKEKYGSDPDRVMWRPQLADVNSQLRAHDAANLIKQKTHLEALAKEYEARVNRLKKRMSAKRGYMKALQLDIQRSQMKSESLLNEINEKLERDNIDVLSLTKTDIDEERWLGETEI